MNVQVSIQTPDDLQAIVGFVYEDLAAPCEKVTALKDKKIFEAKVGEIFYTLDEKGVFRILVGLGQSEEITRQEFVEAVGKATKQAAKLKATHYGVVFPEVKGLCTGGITKAITEGCMLADYDFDKYKSKKEDKLEMTATILNPPAEKVDKMVKKIAEATEIAKAIMFARDLVNEPSDVIYPETLAEQAIACGKASGFEVEVLDENQIKDLGMNAFLAVGKGSVHPPRLIVMRYHGDPSQSEVTGLVGKGLTFDTGGYCLKPGAGMEAMKGDMAGAAAVIGTMAALAKNKADKNVVAVVAACENAISGGSYKPGDILTSMAGKTIEVLNTDAEGRLTLIDAVTYIIEKEKVDKVVDVATLTGAAVAALGQDITAVIANDDAYYELLLGAAKRSGEKFWRLPNDKCYKKLYKGDVADLKNTGGRYAGTITAGMFIEEFVQGKPWLHLDIAGTSATDKATSVCPMGGTGTPIKTLYELVVQHTCKHH